MDLSIDPTNGQGFLDTDPTDLFLVHLDDSQRLENVQSIVDATTDVLEEKKSQKHKGGCQSLELKDHLLEND